MTDIKRYTVDEIRCGDCNARVYADKGIKRAPDGAMVYHEDIEAMLAAKDAEIERLTAELAAARKPQGMRFPRANERKAAIGWTLDTDLLQRIQDLTPGARLGTPTIQAVLLALESLGAQDGGEGKVSTCSRWVHGDCMCVKPPGHDGRCDCACYVTEDPS